MGRRIHNWTDIQILYDTGISTKTLKEQYGISYHAIERAIKRGDFIRRSRTEANSRPIDTIKKRETIKYRILREGLIPYICSECGQLPEHNGKPLVLQLHHKDGINNNHDIDNLTFLCPNCHTQTETYAGKNKKA